MVIDKQTKKNAVRISAVENGEELGAVYLYLIKNDSSKKPYALLEDLFVKEGYRKKGIGSTLVKKAIADAKKLGCYKIIGTSRFSRVEVHGFYKRLGMKKYGFEFRLNL